ncbi:MarR family transcriptional regulator [Sansalvadorimonas sp. 2012CJ34-2]|uniref:MarR family transcriptional regulator n=1 Tax=Parendozoicomonas callyspongiae TaxID=2942213 RepID=A0ABT0PH12_9GAMM|nr:MarR family transcriptional regulator [Sansalvadorimonas sp. 2012CJ34-2]MCL6270644.1 MarR family transcriptional regulator [Sansalvadorimonas sp. 2012CJ34-2]
MAQDLKEICCDLHELAFYFSNLCCHGESCEDFSLLEFKALRYISAHECCPVQAIGQSLRMTKSGATRLVSRLVKRGLIERKVCCEDARIRLLSITPAGRECMDSVAQFQRQRIASMLSRMEGVDCEQVHTVLRALARAI